LDTIGIRFLPVLVSSVTAAALDTNCYVLAPGPGGPCVLVDPGFGVLAALRGVLEQHRLSPVAVLVTHGHLDHVHDAAAVQGAEWQRDAQHRGDGGAKPPGVYIHRADRYRLADPYAQLGTQLAAMLEQQLGPRAAWTEPEHVVELSDGQTLDLAGLSITVRHAPGHTEGSALYEVAGVPDGLDPAAGHLDRTVLTGDVLFAGTIGRTDLGGGDHRTMLHTLESVVLALPDTSLVLPGHGPATTMARERAANPFLGDLR
jgi:glyoxylase-like metal-dependent hydrolase (beta-lactamase superfamily II)